MRTLLIVFAILLLLLTLLGTFGGSIKYTEPFYDATPIKGQFSNDSVDDNMGMDKSEYRNIGDPEEDDATENFYNDMPVTATADMNMNDMTNKSQFYDGIPGGPSQSDEENKRPDTAYSQFNEQVPGEMPTYASHYTNSPDNMNNNQYEDFSQQEFNIEPFEAEAHSSLPAGY
jgi:hypothetical protein